MLKDHQQVLTESKNVDAFAELLESNLYVKKMTQSAHSSLLLDPEKVLHLKPEKSHANRCTVFGTNAILGSHYFLNLRQFFKNLSSHKSYEEIVADFAKTNCIPLPIKNPFATVQIQNNLVNVTFVPKAQLCGAEIENFTIEPLLLDVCLTIRAETTRAAVVLSGPVDPKGDTGSLNHMVVFQYSPDLGRWEYINPPAYHHTLDKTLFKR